MKKRAVAVLLTAVMAVTGMSATVVCHAESEEGMMSSVPVWKQFIRKLSLHPVTEPLQP